MLRGSLKRRVFARMDADLARRVADPILGAFYRPTLVSSKPLRVPLTIMEACERYAEGKEQAASR